MKVVLDGIKMLALQDIDGIWWKVVQDCVHCMECCLDKGVMWPFADSEGRCKYIDEDTKLCSLKSERPLSCCLNHPTAKDEYCKVVLRRMSIVEKWELIT